MCKAASGLDGSMSMAEAMDLNKKVAEFAENNADKMTDLKKTAEAMDITRC
jgi:phage host-nuclease inhibitor protein Gam